MPEKTVIIAHGKVVTVGSERVEVIEDGAVVIEGDTIVAVGPFADVAAASSSSATTTVVDARGMLVMPGFVCAHTHFYGMYARGMDLHDAPPADFPQVLARLWWRVDRALDADACYLSALALGADGLRCGTTTVLDHHASPAHAAGSLDAVARATTELGMRAALCYEVSDRNGDACAAEGIAENVRFLRRVAARGADPLLGATFGIHAPFTCSDATLAACADAAAALRAEFGADGPAVGFHLHVAEGAVDEERSLAEHGTRCVQRLERLGILGPATVVGHGVHMDADERAVLARTRTALVTNPESNMNNGVGLPDVSDLVAKGVLVGLGTDGMTLDMLLQYRASCFAHKHRVRDPREGTLDSFAMLFRNNSLIASRYFQKPVGRFEPGCFGDVVLIDYHAPTPLTAGNLPWHLCFGVTSADVHSVFVGGRLVVSDHKLLTVDIADVARRATAAAPRVWAEVAAIAEREKKEAAAAAAATAQQQ